MAHHTIDNNNFIHTKMYVTLAQLSEVHVHWQIVPSEGEIS